MSTTWKPETCAPEPDAIDLVRVLDVGSQYRLRGKVYTVRDGCRSFYVHESIGGCRATLPVWRPDGQPSLVTIRPASRVEVLHECYRGCSRHQPVT